MINTILIHKMYLFILYNLITKHFFFLKFTYILYNSFIMWFLAKFFYQLSLLFLI